MKQLVLDDRRHNFFGSVDTVQELMNADSGLFVVAKDAGQRPAVDKLKRDGNRDVLKTLPANCRQHLPHGEAEQL